MRHCLAPSACGSSFDFPSAFTEIKTIIENSQNDGYTRACFREKEPRV
jgi:hypothetical protein